MSAERLASIARYLEQELELGGASVILPAPLAAPAPARGAVERPVVGPAPSPESGAVQPPVAKPAPQAPTQPPEGGPEGSAWQAPDGRLVKGSAERIALAQLFYDVRECQDCALGEGRTRFVFGTGSPNPEVLLVGEAPGAAEDRQGLPFVGPAGRLLDELLAAVGMSRKQNVFICNVLKCRPPGNRDPRPEEVVRCSPILRRQLEILHPRIIVTLGRFAAQTLLKTDAPMGRLRRRVHDCAGTPLIATYHPAYLLRNPEARVQVEADLRQAAQTIELAGR